MLQLRSGAKLVSLRPSFVLHAKFVLHRLSLCSDLISIRSPLRTVSIEHTAAPLPMKAGNICMREKRILSVAFSRSTTPLLSCSSRWAQNLSRQTPAIRGCSLDSVPCCRRQSRRRLSLNVAPAFPQGPKSRKESARVAFKGVVLPGEQGRHVEVQRARSRKTDREHFLSVSLVAAIL